MFSWKWLLVAAGASALWSQTQSEQFNGNHFHRFALREAAFQRMGDWRMEFRIHGFRAEARDQGIIGGDDNPCSLMANSVVLRCRTWHGSSNTVDLNLAGRSDVRVRMQRATGSGVFLVEIWNGDGSGYASAGLRIQSTTYDGRRENNFIGALFGKGTEFRGGIAFVRWYSSLLPQQSRPPLDTVAEPANLLHVDFEDRVTKDSGPLRISITRDGAGAPVYIDSPVYKPVISLSTANVARAGQDVTLDFSRSFASSGDGSIAGVVVEQLAGPAPIQVDIQGLLANSLLPIAGTYYIQVTVTDSAGRDATGIAELSAVATDPAGRVIPYDERAAQVTGPVLMSGASPWPWFDTTEVRVAEALMTTIEKTPGAPLDGKISVSVGSKRITGDGTKFRSTFRCDGSDNIAVHYPVSAATPTVTGLRVYNVTSCPSDTEVAIDPAFDATAIDWRNVGYGRVTNEENAHWYNGSNNWNYYDAVLAFYRLYYRTGKDRYRDMARTLADRWWKYPLDEGRACMSGYWCVAPRVMSLLGLMLRANDGRPEMWPVILDIADRNHVSQISNWFPDTSTNVYDIREMGYVSWWQAAIASLHPDAAVRAGALQKAELGFRKFWKPKQLADGSWRMDIGNACPSCGYAGPGTQPWQMAFPLQALMALHQLDGDPEVLDSLQKGAEFLRRYGIDPQCRGMYYDLFYTKCAGTDCGQCPFGTCGKYNCEKNGAYPGNDSRTLSNATHSLFGYLYAVTGNDMYLTTGDDLFSANLGGNLGGPGADGGSGHYNDVISGGTAPSYLAPIYLSKEFAFVGGAGGAQNYLAWRLGRPPERTWAQVDLPFDLTTVEGAVVMRAIVVSPNGAQEVFTCPASPCTVRMDQRQGDHVLVVQYLDESGMVLKEDKPSRLRLP
jgi:hypothetical protein